MKVEAKAETKGKKADFCFTVVAKLKPTMLNTMFLTNDLDQSVTKQVATG